MQRKYFNPAYWLDRVNDRRLKEWEKEMREMADWETKNVSLRILDVTMLDEYFRSLDNNIIPQTMDHKTEQDYEPSVNYVKGFNEGYAIAKYLPEVADKLSDVLGNSERAKGFQLGRQEYLMEMDKDKTKDAELYPDWLRNDYTINRDDIEKEDIEPEID